MEMSRVYPPVASSNCSGGDRGHTGMNRTDLAGQHALIEPSVAPPKDSPAIRGELRGNAQTWRHDVPGVQRAQARNDPARLVPFRIDRVEILTDGAAVVEPHTRVDGQALADRQGVARECRPS